MIRRNRYFLIGLVVIMALTAFMVRSLKAETLTAVQPGTDWTFVIAIVVIIALVAGIAYLLHRYPSQSSAVSKVMAEELGKIRALLETKHPVADHVSTAVPTLTAEVKGRNGQAGIFTLEVTGDPKVDLPALNEKYFS